MIFYAGAEGKLYYMNFANENLLSPTLDIKPTV
jgi:hypothetical protein